MLNWYCEKLHCKMTREACEKRRYLANNKRRKTDSNNYRDAGCGACTQTEGIQPMENNLSSIPKVCKVCGQSKLSSQFALNARSSDGLEHKCKSCRKQPCRGDRPVALVEDENTMVSKPQEVDPPVAPTDDLEIDAIISSSREDRIIITIDFSEYPDLHSVLQLHAYSEMRTPEMQAAYMLRELLIDIKPVIEKKWGEWA